MIGGQSLAGRLTKCDLELIQGVQSRLVDARILARRADIHSGKQVRQRRMVLPERHHAAQQIRPAQQRTIQHGRSADHDMAAAAGCDMATVVVEFFSGQAISARFFERAAC